MMRIVLCFPVESSHIEKIRAAAPSGAEIIDAGQERIATALPTADVFVGHAKVPVDWGRVLETGRLKWIQSSAAGLDHCLVPGVIHSEIIVTSASGLFAPQVTEQTLALLFGLLRRIPTFIAATAKKEFIRRPTDDLRGKRVGIVGLGGNGRAIARALRPLCSEIVATDYFPDYASELVDALWPHDQLERLLFSSQIVILALPLNSQTEGMFNAERFNQMQPGSYLINVARGPVIKEQDLVSALQSGHIQAAGLDVTEIEPLPQSSPLWDLPNVLITPHVGAQSYRRVDDTVELVCENLRRWQAGQPLYNRVDKRLGFPHPDAIWNATT